MSGVDVEALGMWPLCLGIDGDCTEGRDPNPCGVRWSSWLLDKFSVMLDRRKRLGLLRRYQHKPSQMAMAPGHTHPECAKLRADASRVISSVSKALGRRRFDISMSPRERLMSNTAGSRQFRTAKDLLVERVCDKLLPEDLVSMVDTDYYLRPEELHGFAGHDMALYALTPTGLSGTTANSHWGFVSTGEVVEEVAGGARYRHQVWDWTGEMLVLHRGFSTYLYDIHRIQLSESRCVVVLLLARVLRLPMVVASWLLPSLRMFEPKRMRVAIQGGYLVGVFGNPTSKAVHLLGLGMPGSRHVRLPVSLFATLEVAAKIPNSDRKVGGMELLPSAVERISKAAGVKLDAGATHVVSDYFTHAYQPHEFVNYQACGDLEWEDGETTVRQAAPCPVGPGVGPTSSANNEQRAVEKRVVEVRNTTPFPSDGVKYGLEFAKMVVRFPGRGVPLGRPELRKQQDKPQQKARRLQEEQFEEDLGSSMHTTSFQKRESYAKVSDPRLINQVSTDHTNRLCSYSSAIKPALKQHKWYFVGKNPTEVAVGLRGLAGSGGVLTGGDYSRMDGRTSNGYRQHVLYPIYLLHFAEEYHGELKQLLEREMVATTTTRRARHKAALSGANISGSGITTDLNTCNAAFNEYAARRRLGQSPGQAFTSLGAYFGDDSVVREEVFDAVAGFASECGMKLEREPRPKCAGEGFVAFLARQYPDIRTSLASHPDPVRSLRKLTTVTAGRVAPERQLLMKLSLKVKALLETDPHVPFVSGYGRALERVLKLREVKAKASEWEAMERGDADYARKRALGPYPATQRDMDLLRPSVAEGLGLTEQELMKREQQVDACSSVEDLRGVQTGVPECSLPEWARWVQV